MRQRFEGELVNYNELVKKEEAGEDATEELKLLLKKFAMKEHNSVEVQQQIYNIQVQKQALLSFLKRDLALIDRGEYEPDLHNHSFVVREEDGKFMTGQGDNHYDLSEGDILTGDMWRINFCLDPKTVSRHMQKKFVIEKTKAKILYLLNKQIALNEINKKKTDSFRKNAFEHSLNNGFADTNGVVVERIIISLLKKMAFDKKNIGVEITDVYNDVRNKIDVIVKSSARGSLQPKKERKVGLQVTILRNQQKFNEKKHILEQAKGSVKESVHLDDLCLVRIPPQIANQLLNAYYKWRNSDDPRGPVHFIGDEIKPVLKMLLMPVFPGGQHVKYVDDFLSREN